jgi:hypothetical protein
MSDGGWAVCWSAVTPQSLIVRGSCKFTAACPAVYLGDRTVPILLLSLTRNPMLPVLPSIERLAISVGP